MEGNREVSEVSGYHSCEILLHLHLGLVLMMLLAFFFLLLIYVNDIHVRKLPALQHPKQMGQDQGFFYVNALQMLEEDVELDPTTSPLFQPTYLHTLEAKKKTKVVAVILIVVV